MSPKPLEAPPGEERSASVSREEIETGLRQLGLGRGDVVETHTSLSAFGFVEGSASTIIDALINTVGARGAIVMSCYPLSRVVRLSPEERERGLRWKTRVLSEASSERTSLGLVADTFKARPDVVCGHGIHRVCAWGKHKHRYSEGYKRLVDDGGFALLLGVGIDRCSSMHLADDVPVPPEIAAYWEVPADVQCDYPANKWAIGIGDGPPEDAWAKAYARADEQGLIRHQRIGSASCHLFRAHDLIALFAEWKRSDPYGLYGVRKSGE